MKTLTRLSILGLVVLVGIGMAYAGFSNPADAVRYRKSAMQLIGYHFKSMGAVVQGKMAYDKAAFERDAMIVAAVSDAAWEEALAEGSAMGDTTLKESALKEKAAFMALSKDFHAAAASLAAAAEKGDLDAAKGTFGETAKSCKACHGTYRK
ncbi:MAG: cytochrome c [Pseudomonadota bacterium]